MGAADLAIGIATGMAMNGGAIDAPVPWFIAWPIYAFFAVLVLAVVAYIALIVWDAVLTKRERALARQRFGKAIK